MRLYRVTVDNHVTYWVASKGSIPIEIQTIIDDTEGLNFNEDGFFFTYIECPECGHSIVDEGEN